MDKQTAIKVAANLFQHYPDQKTFFITSDEQAFFEHGTAASHAATLDPAEPVVVEVTREEATEKPKVELTKEQAEKAVETAKAKVTKATQAVEAADKKNNADAKLKAKANLEKAEQELASAEKALEEFNG